ncbi:Hypothetical protein NTJ_00973 [Nesidiocoris tenuis]|uniref:Uncharacterized protein n=1 Tax=Nesidiocoris tenuis TaxID=355587 RepID=A0ABN7A7B1_9HEMI|nr:Hypothetical protein NTJ_00973 [Nesidiocoris tenuis]
MVFVALRNTDRDENLHSPGLVLEKRPFWNHGMKFEGAEVDHLLHLRPHRAQTARAGSGAVRNLQVLVAPGRAGAVQEDAIGVEGAVVAEEKRD